MGFWPSGLRDVLDGGATPFQSNLTLTTPNSAARVDEAMDVIKKRLHDFLCKGYKVVRSLFSFHVLYSADSLSMVHDKNGCCRS